MSFRQWVQNIWFDHCEEVEAWEQKSPCYSTQEYFIRYKWWLKREYRHQTR